MGTTGLFAENAEKLNADIGHCDVAIITHAHFDHGGGLETFFNKNRETKVYLHEKSKGDYFANVAIKLPDPVKSILPSFVIKSEKFSRYIGLDRTLIKKFPDRFICVNDLSEIRRDVFIITDIENRYPLCEGNRHLLQKKEGKLVSDSFDHEIVPVISDPDGLVVFCGCGHNGILNILESVRKKFQNTRIKGVVGGFHLKKNPVKEKNISGTPEEIEFIARQLLEDEINVYTGHCTGEMAFGILKKIMKDKLNRLHTGSFFEI